MVYELIRTILAWNNNGLTKLPLPCSNQHQAYIHIVFTISSYASMRNFIFCYREYETNTIIAMAKSLGMGVIAEAVETEAQRTFLEQHDCPLYQGYLFSKPVPIEKFEALLN
jgi:c-di-GMP-related signal transduction protein